MATPEQLAALLGQNKLASPASIADVARNTAGNLLTPSGPPAGAPVWDKTQMPSIADLRGAPAGNALGDAVTARNPGNLLRNAAAAPNALGEAVAARGVPPLPPAPTLASLRTAPAVPNALGEAVAARGVPPAPGMPAALGETVPSRALAPAPATPAPAAPVSRLPAFTPPAQTPIDLARPFEQQQAAPNVNPNVARNAMSAEAAAFQQAGGGRALPAQVGVQGHPAAPSGVPPAGGWPKAPAGAPATGDGFISRLRGVFGLDSPGAAPAATGNPASAGAIRSAAEATLGNGQQWSEFGANARKVAGKVGTVVGKIAKPLAAPLGAIETYQGLRDGDNSKAAWGAADTIAGAALFTPAAPAAGLYLTGRGAWEGGKMLGNALPEAARDAIGSGVNSVAKLFGGGVDDSAYKAQVAAAKPKQTTLSDLITGGAKPTAKPAAAKPADAELARVTTQAGAEAPAVSPIAAAATNAGQAPAPDALQQQRQAKERADIAAEHLADTKGVLNTRATANLDADSTGGDRSVTYEMKDGREITQQYKRGQLVPDANNALDIGAIARFDNRLSRSNLLDSQAPAPAAAPQAPAGQPAGPSLLTGNQKTLHDEAVSQGYDPQRALMISSIETGGKFNTDAKNPKSSAYGLVQMMQANRDGYGLSPAEWKTAGAQARTGIDFMKKTDADLTTRLGRPPTPAESYMGHLFGPSGASAVLSADPNASIQSVVAAYDPNKAAKIVKDNGMSGMTAGQAIAKWNALAAKHMPAPAVDGGQAPAAEAQAPTTIADAAPSGYSGMVMTGKGTLVDGQPMPQSILAGGQQQLQAYLDAGQQHAINAADPTAAATTKSIELEELKGENELAKQDRANAGNLQVAQAGLDRAGNRYIPFGGGVDPETGMMTPKQLWDAQTNQAVDTTANKQYTPAEIDAESRKVLKGGGDKELINARRATYGLKPL